MATAAAAAAAKPEDVDREAAIAGLKAKAQLRGLLKSTLRVKLSDGRIVTGQYQVRVCGWVFWFGVRLWICVLCTCVRE